LIYFPHHPFQSNDEVAVIPAELQELQNTIESIDPDRMTPREALDALYELKSLIRQVKKTALRRFFYAPTEKICASEMQ
jgi:hypothetical protein